MLREGVVIFFALVLNHSWAFDCFTCHTVWSKGVEIENSEFHSYVNNSRNHLHKSVWKWPSEDGTGSWEVFFNKWSNKGIKSGGLVFFRHNRPKQSFVNWKITDKTLLTWTSDNEKLPFETWNLTLCESNVKVRFDPSKTSWTFHLGNIRIPGGDSGKMFISEKFFEPSYGKVRAHSKVKLIRHRRDEPEAEKLEESSIWNRLKGYFKELFDSGPNDQRGWMTRIADWIMGFLERVLS